MNSTCSSSEAQALFRSLIRLDVEELWVVALSANLRPLRTELIFRGSADQCPAHPREILRFLCLQNAVSFLMAHSHPSGDPTPSRKDLVVTRNIMKLSELLGIQMLDHLIISENSYFSLSDHGYLKKKRLEALFLQPES